MSKKGIIVELKINNFFSFDWVGFDFGTRDNLTFPAKNNFYPYLIVKIYMKGALGGKVFLHISSKFVIYCNNIQKCIFEKFKYFFEV